MEGRGALCLVPVPHTYAAHTGKRGWGAEGGAPVLALKPVNSPKAAGEHRLCGAAPGLEQPRSWNKDTGGIARLKRPGLESHQTGGPTLPAL